MSAQTDGGVFYKLAPPDTKRIRWRCADVTEGALARAEGASGNRVVTVFELDAYLARIGLPVRVRLQQVHRAHVTSIPFEDLDPQGGVPVSLAVEDLEHKLVAE